MNDFAPPEIPADTTASDGLSMLMFWIIEGANDPCPQNSAAKIGMRLAAICRLYCPELYRAKGLDRVFPEQEEA